ncbi:MAG TPA: MFS transporter [Labilithrix sp.]|nr:MFS transporter [Labilithrix sp.]
MTHSRPPAFVERLRTFWIFAAGELMSDVGSALATFTIDVWVYQESKSVSSLAIVHVLSMIPGVLLSPIAGAWVDRINRRTITLACNAGLALIAAVIAVAAFTSHLDPMFLFVMAPLIGVLRTVLNLSLIAATAQLVPVSDIPRVHGLLGAAGSLIGMLSPTVASFLVARIGPAAVLAIDVGTFVIALGTGWIVRLPDPERGKDEPGSSVWRETLAGLRFVMTRPGLSGLLSLATVGGFSLQMATLLLTPLVLTIRSLAELGTVLSAGGIGGLVGAFAVGILGGRARNRMKLVLLCSAVSAISVVVAGLTTTLGLLAIAAFAVELAEPVAASMRRTIWQAKVPTHMFGRTLALQQTAGSASSLLALMLAGPLADHVLEPAMRGDGLLVSTLGRVMGTGPGRGMGVLLVLLGLLYGGATLRAALTTRVRRVETDLPDACHSIDA